MWSAARGGASRGAYLLLEVPAPLGGAHQLLESLFNTPGEEVDVGDAARVAQIPEVEPAHVAEDGDRQALSLVQKGDGKRLDQARAAEVQGKLGTRDICDDEIESDLAERRARHHRMQRGGGEPSEVQQEVRAHCLLAGFQP